MNDEIQKYKLKMNQARINGNWKAYKDLKKHYDKLITRERKNNGL